MSDVGFVAVGPVKALSPMDEDGKRYRVELDTGGRYPTKISFFRQPKEPKGPDDINEGFKVLQEALFAPSKMVRVAGYESPGEANVPDGHGGTVKKPVTWKNGTKAEWVTEETTEPQGYHTPGKAAQEQPGAPNQASQALPGPSRDLVALVALQTVILTNGWPESESEAAEKARLAQKLIHLAKTVQV